MLRENKSTQMGTATGTTNARETPMIDLRSDTVTLPTADMRTAMQKSMLGDDVYGEDPTVTRLERHVAELLGFTAGLFVPSGTMANLCAMLTHCPRGARVLLGDQSHVYCYEAGGASVLGGLFLHPLRNTGDGTFDDAELSAALQSPDDPHIAPAGLLALENTHARCGGVPLPAARVKALADAAHAHGVKVHVDGARLFNAAIALGVRAASLVQGADSVQVCFSKGLCAPVGSMLVSSVDFIARARRVRKMLGGGMRQAGVLAAPCQIAIDTMIPRLADDHARARALAAAISVELSPTGLRVDEPRSNIIMIRDASATGAAVRLERHLRAESVLASGVDATRLRVVLHAGIDDDAVTKATAAFQRAATSLMAD
jgi:threonine aldolase